jgi:hypothetical protein
VRSLKVRLDTGLAALHASVEGNTAFAAGHLRELGALCQPLLASPISGEYSIISLGVTALILCYAVLLDPKGLLPKILLRSYRFAHLRLPCHVCLICWIPAFCCDR